MITLKKENKFYHLTFNGNKYITPSLDITFEKIKEFTKENVIKIKPQTWKEIKEDKIRFNSI